MSECPIILTDSHIIVGNGSNVGADVAMSGDVTINNSGVTAIKTSVALGGSPTTTTQSQGNNSTKIATTAYVDGAIGSPFNKASATSQTSIFSLQVPAESLIQRVWITENAGSPILDLLAMYGTPQTLTIANIVFGTDVVAATSDAVSLTATYNNGSSGVGATLTNSGTQQAFTLNGHAISAGQRVLIANQVDPTQNGIYTVTVAGNGSTNWVLTRATDFDQPGDIIPGTLFQIGADSDYDTYIVRQSCSTIGTDAIHMDSLSIPSNDDAGVLGLTCRVSANDVLSIINVQTPFIGTAYGDAPNYVGPAAMNFYFIPISTGSTVPPSWNGASISASIFYSQAG